MSYDNNQDLEFSEGFLLVWHYFLFDLLLRSVYKELHADHETGAADNK